MKDSGPVLVSHRLTHLPRLSIHPNVLQGRFPRHCGPNRCQGLCCRDGVWVDLAERDSILAQADLIRRYMEHGQQSDPAGWFDPEVRDDSDFPSGKAIGTAVHGSACVFLNSSNRCVLQKAGENQTFNLKPFFCTAFPITIDNGELQVDDRCYDENCCTLSAEGGLAVLEACSMELNHVLGPAGVRELESIATMEHHGAHHETPAPGIATSL